MTKGITINKHEFNVRRVDELNLDILAKEQELLETEGFYNTLKVKLELRKLYKQINNHGSEVLLFEQGKQFNLN